MVSGVQLFLALFNNLAMLIVLVAGYGMLYRYLAHRSLFNRQLLLGLFFGLLAIACMYIRIPVHEGVIVDQRNAVVALSGAFGGPLTAVISASMAAAYRVLLGGGGVPAGVIGVVLAALAGILIHFLREKIDNLTKAACSAMLATIIILPGFLFVGDLHDGWQLMKSMALPYGSALFLGILLGGLLLAREEHRHNEMAERRKSVRRLRQSEERFRTTLNSIGDAVIATDTEGRVVHINPVAEALTGWSAAEACGAAIETIFHIVNEDSRQPVLNPVDLVLEHGKIIGLANHTLLISRDKKEIPIADSAAPIKDETGAITGVVLVFRDQTEERDYQRQLLASEERFRSIVENAPDPIFIQSEMRFVYLNPRSLQLFGADDAAQLLHTPVLDRVHPDFHDTALQRIRKLNHEREPVTQLFKVKFLCLDGEEIWVETSGHPVTFMDRPGALVFVRDITERVQAEHERDKLQAQLIQAQKMESVGRLTGGVAHDFNNILGVIIGYTDLAMERAANDEVLRNDLEKILDAANRSAEIIRQLLAFSRQQTISPKVLDLNDAVTSMLKMLRRLIGEDIELAWLPCAQPVTVKMDPAQIDQILANLCVNARDAIDGTGRITIRTRLANIEEQDCIGKMDCSPGQFVQLTISDDGCGMPPDYLDKIFEPFFTSKEVGHGTGLGLSTVYGIVRQNQGFIEVASTLLRGTTFTISIPYCAPQEEACKESSTTELARGKGETILVVEDDPVLLNMAISMLEKIGYRVIATNKPTEAITIAHNHADTIDLLLTDVIMPGMSGKELADILKDKFPRLKLLFMSGYTVSTITERGILAEGINFIHKPFTTQALAAKIHEVLADK